MAVTPFLDKLADRRLKEIIIPGSHDAGLAAEYAQQMTRLSSDAKTVTQSVGVGEQAQAGSRFFDVRVQKIDGAMTSFHTAPNLLGKVPLVNKIKATKTDTRTGGASGQGFDGILTELRQFVVSNPTEFVIVRLSHLKDSADLFTELWAWIANAANTAHVHRGTGNLAIAKVSDLAGKLVFVIEAKKFKHASVPPAGGAARIPGQADGFHKFYQSKGGALPSVNDGLCVCGEFSNKKKLDDILEKQVKNYAEHDKHKNCRADEQHLYSLYWTATGGDIADNTSKQLTNENFKKVRAQVVKVRNENWEKAMSANPNMLMPNSAKSKQDLFNDENRARTKFAVQSASIPNIILYDFVNEGTSQAIVDLNDVVAK